MAFLLLFLGVFCGEGWAKEPNWKGSWVSAKELLPFLELSAEGSSILKDAKARDPNFAEKIRFGQASFTESTFSRTYSLLDGKEKINLDHTVVLNQKLPLSDAILDLAHELVHFTEKKMLDPYGKNFSLVQFVRQGIEGQGGELAALEKECKTAWELKERFSGFPTHYLCSPYKRKEGFDREKAKRDYYALGAWIGDAPDSMRKEIKEISEKRVVLSSSFARKPYPIALAEEFQSTLRSACENNRKKYELITAQAEGGRAPASDLLARERVRLKTYQKIYCHFESSGLER